MADSKYYWAQSMVLSRTLGIEYRQNDLTVNVRTGKILIRSKSCKKLGLDMNTAVVLRAWDLKDPGKLRLEAWKDPQGALPHHLIPAAPGSKNMVTWCHQTTRAWGRRLKVKESLRLKIVSVVRLSDRQTLIECQPVKDLAEICKNTQFIE